MINEVQQPASELPSTPDSDLDHSRLIETHILPEILAASEAPFSPRVTDVFQSRLVGLARASLRSLDQLCCRKPEILRDEDLVTFLVVHIAARVRRFRSRLVNGAMNLLARIRRSELAGWFRYFIGAILRTPRELVTVPLLARPPTWARPSLPALLRPTDPSANPCPPTRGPPRAFLAVSA